MRPGYFRSQGGFTLIEVIIASAIGLIVMTALTSVILTTVQGAKVATGRIEASGQIRNFELRAYDDFALSEAPTPSGCGTSSDPCTTAPLSLSGLAASNSDQPEPSAYAVTYQWDGSAFLDRTVGDGPAEHMATSVTAFAWYVDTSGPKATVVISLTVTVLSYSESQTFRFYPRLNP